MVDVVLAALLVIAAVAGLLVMLTVLSNLAEIVERRLAPHRRAKMIVGTIFYSFALAGQFIVLFIAFSLAIAFVRAA